MLSRAIHVFFAAFSSCRPAAWKDWTPLRNADCLRIMCVHLPALKRARFCTLPTREKND